MRENAVIELPHRKQILPPFRQDLQLFQGPDEPDGSPSYNLLDPVKGQYYKIAWGESLIIKFFEPGMTVEELCKTINTRSTLKVTPEEVKSFFEDAGRHNLLNLPKTSERVTLEAESIKVNPIKWLIFHYLYIRIPLFDPNRFLKKTYSFVKPLFSSLAIFIYSSLFLIGIGALFTRFDEFLHTFPYFFNLKGALIYAIVLTLVKIIHEFSHAYTAARYGVRVPAMGIALLVLWPVLFTDVTDGWRLSQRRHRLAISLAGIIAECIIAGLCTFGWAFSSPGLLQSLFFVIASAGWISTILLNANPAMRFDGYYILSDLWGVDNLRPRAFAVTRCKLREWFLGLTTPQQEKNLSTRRMYGMVAYSLYTWIYRLFLYTAIALFVYISFTKALGIFLFFFEISIFMVWPVVSEMKALIALRGSFKKNLRVLLTSLGLAALFIWFALPLPRTEVFSAITIPVQEQILYVPRDAIIEEIFVTRNQKIIKGQPIIRLVSKELDHETKALFLESKVLARKIKILGLEDEDRAYIPENKRELEAIKAKRKGVAAHIHEMALLSELDGQLFFWDENLRANQAVSKDKILGKIADTNTPAVVCFVPESLLHTVREGQDVEFVLASTHETFKGTIESISPIRENKLDYPALASKYNGNLPVVEDSEENLLLVESYYPVRITLDRPSDKLLFGQVGNVRVQGPRRSLLVTTIKSLTRLLWKESGI